MRPPGVRSSLRIAFFATFAVACVDAQVTRIGPNRPARPEGCAVELVPDGRPSQTLVDVATADVSCSGDREKCVDELRRVACKVGADTAYGFSETRQAGFTHLVATLAARPPATADGR